VLLVQPISESVESGGESVQLEAYLILKKILNQPLQIWRVIRQSAVRQAVWDTVEVLGFRNTIIEI
jgi:hypothetical protein